MYVHMYVCIDVFICVCIHVHWLWNQCSQERDRQRACHTSDTIMDILDQVFYSFPPTFLFEQEWEVSGLPYKQVSRVKNLLWELHSKKYCSETDEVWHCSTPELKCDRVGGQCFFKLRWKIVDTGRGNMHVLMYWHGPGSYKDCILMLWFTYLLRYVCCMCLPVSVGGAEFRSFVEIIWSKHLRVMSQLCNYVLI